MLLISKHFNFHLTFSHAQRADCCKISLIDKKHFTFLLQGTFVFFTKKNLLQMKALLENVSYRNSSAAFPLCLRGLFATNEGG
ncbi:MAG: hypothetical protein C4538_11370 [Nitrospiraceae bacterium]|nr:MAG: hypothetical protein C4538_11370 [Nitrospiraceae bacterium]